MGWRANHHGVGLPIIPHKLETDIKLINYAQFLQRPYTLTNVIG